MPDSRWYEAYRPHSKEEVSGELKGPCPNCGGDDRFYIKPDGTFGCRPGKGCDPGKNNQEAYKAIAQKLDAWAGIERSTKKKKEPWKFLRDHVYYRADGSKHVKRTKWQTPEGRNPFTPEVWDGNKWIKGKGKFLLDELLYNRPQLTPETETVILLEGEKDCDLFQKLFAADVPRVVGVAGAGGAGNAYLDWQAMAHVKELFIFFDADPSGRSGAREYGRKAIENLPNVKVKVYGAKKDDLERIYSAAGKEYPGDEDKGPDFADVYEALGKKGAVRWLKIHKIKAYTPDVPEVEDEARELLLSYLQGGNEPPEILFAEMFLADQARKGTNEWRYDLHQKLWFRLLPTGRWEGSNERFALTIKELVHTWIETSMQWGRAMYEKLWAKTGKRSYISNVIKVLSEHHNSLHTDGKEWDQDPEMLGTPSGVWCLRELRKLSRTEAGPKMITQAAAIEPELGANPQSRWNQFISELVSNDQDEHLFLMQYLGYCLTGYTSERKFLFIKGVTRNGKSVLLDTLKYVFGDYVTVAPRSEFQWRPPSQAGAPTTEIMEFQGRRLVLLDEQEDIRWDVEKLKNIVAGGWLKGRRMRQDPIEFKSYCKLVIASNHNPRFDADEALKSRFLALACRFVPPVPDPLLTKTLESEAAHILGMLMQFAQAWIVDCRSQKEFLPVPKSVIRERDFLMDDADEYRLFLTDECEVTRNEVHRVPNAALAAAFRQWTEDQGMTLPETMTDRKITFRLKKSANGIFGLRPYRSGKERGISGIKLGMLATQSSAF